MVKGRFLVGLGLSLIIGWQVRADSLGVFTYQDGSFTTIANSSSYTPLGIDAAGDLLLATDGNIGSPVLLSGGNFITVSVPGSALTEGLAISQNGTILGAYVTSTRAYFVDLNGSITPIGLSGLTRTTGNALINDQGQILSSNSACCNQPDFIYNYHTGSVTPVNFPGATDTSLIAINNNGQVLGSAATSSGFVYFIDTAGTFSALNLPAGCSPDGINDSQEIVGNCFTEGLFRGFLDKSGVFTYITYNGNSNLNDTFISDINDSGEIVGTFQNVSESSTLSLVAAGFLFLAVILQWKRFHWLRLA